MLLQRWALQNLIKKLTVNRIVVVAGCRQSGKTTLLTHAPMAQTVFRSLNDAETLQDAEEDPAYFVRRKTDSVLVIDEVQKAQALIGQIKFAVDRNPQKGQYVICGSSDYRKLPHANESLAGRAGFVRVRPFCEAERRGMPPGFLQALFDGKLPLDLTFECSKKEVLDLAIRGGFPTLLATDDQKERSTWYEHCLVHQVISDIKDQWGVRKKRTVLKLLLSAAAVSSWELNKSSMATACNINWRTLNGYWSAFEAMFLIDMLPGWVHKDINRASSVSKPFLADSGLMAHLLGLTSADDVHASSEKSQNKAGKLVKTWVYNQLMPEVDQHPTWRIFYFKNRTHEIDFLVTDGRCRMIGITVKNAESLSKADFKHLKWMQEMVGKDNFTGIVLYAGSEVLPGGDGCFALPMSALWSDFTQWGNWIDVVFDREIGYGKGPATG